MKTGVNHLSTDDTAAGAGASVDAGSASGLSRYAYASYQDYVDFMQSKDDLDGIGLLNIYAGVDILNPTKKTYRDTLTTGTGTKKTLPTSVSRVTLYWWKLYLDSCAAYHTVGQPR